MLACHTVHSGQRAIRYVPVVALRSRISPLAKLVSGCFPSLAVGMRSPMPPHGRALTLKDEALPLWRPVWPVRPSGWGARRVVGAHTRRFDCDRPAVANTRRVQPLNLIIRFPYFPCPHGLYGRPPRKRSSCQQPAHVSRRPPCSHLARHAPRCIQHCDRCTLQGTA